MDPYLDQLSCDMCRLCYRSQTLNCQDACRRCGIARFSDDTVNVYPAPYPIYYNTPKVNYFYQPSQYQFANYYGSYYKPDINYW